MNERPEGEQTPLPSLPCSTILYRLITKASWIDKDTGNVQPAAMVRRFDEDGLSVFIKALCTLPEAIVLSTLTRVKGAVTLHVGHVRDLGLDVLSDPTDRRHAEIVGVPLEAEDLDRAIYLADLLAEQSRVVRS